MLYDAIVEDIASSTGLNARTDRKTIDRKLELALDEIDYLVDWNFAIESFSVAIASGGNSAMVDYHIFRPIVCTYETQAKTSDVPDDQGRLDYLTLTDFLGETAELGDAYTTTTPEKYSVGRDTIYVGPGHLGIAINVTGMVRRKLIFDDLDYLPSILVVSNAIMKIAKAGTPEYIMARADWKGAKELVQDRKSVV